MASNPTIRSPARELHVETVYCLGNCALSPSALARRRADRPARLRPDRRHRRRRERSDAMSARSSFPATRLRCRSARTASPSRSRAKRKRAGSRSRSCAPARAALFWLEPLVEVETAAGRVGYGPVAPRDAAAPVRMRVPDRRRASQGARDGRGHSLSRAPAAPRLRPLRPDRSALARRLSPPWRPQGSGARAEPRAQGDRR